MCPMCIAAGCLYVAGGVSTGAVTTFLATKLSRKRLEPTSITRSTDSDLPQPPVASIKKETPCQS